MPKYLKTCSASFSLNRGASFLLSTLTPFSGCWKSAALAPHDLIHVEVDGKCQFVVGTDTCLSLRFSFDSLSGWKLTPSLILMCNWFYCYLSRFFTIQLQYWKVKEMPKWVSLDSLDSIFSLNGGLTGALGEFRGASQQVLKTDHFNLQKNAAAKKDSKKGGTPVLGGCLLGVH